MTEKYFYAQWTAGEAKTRGLNQASFGHKVFHGPNGKPDGVWADWSWNGDKLVVENDRYGMFPLFYYYRNNEICVSPSIAKILEQGADGELDYSALAVFVHIGFFIGEDTPFKHIKTVPPNATFSWQSGCLNVEGRYHFSERNERISYDDAIDESISLFRQSIKRRLPQDENFVVPLTGGRDSRDIILELNRLGYKPKYAVTVEGVPPTPPGDVEVAALLAGRLKIDHRIVRQPASYFEARKKTFAQTHFCADEHVQFWAMKEHLDSNISASYDGIMGDTLTKGIFTKTDMFSLFEKGYLFNLAETIIKEFQYSYSCVSEESLKSIVSKQLYSKLNKRLAIERLTEELEKHVPVHNPVSSFFFWSRARREIGLAPFAIFRNIPTVFCPYLDYDYYDFMTSLDPALLLSGKFHDDVITRAYPEFSDIPYQSKNVHAADSYTPNPHRLGKQFVGETLDYLLNNLRASSKILKCQNIIPKLVYAVHYKKNPLPWINAANLILYLMELHKSVSLCGSRKMVSVA